MWFICGESSGIIVTYQHDLCSCDTWISRLHMFASPKFCKRFRVFRTSNLTMRCRCSFACCSPSWVLMGFYMSITFLCQAATSPATGLFIDISLRNRIPLSLSARKPIVHTFHTPRFWRHLCVDKSFDLLRGVECLIQRLCRSLGLRNRIRRCPLLLIQEWEYGDGLRILVPRS
jgi:hypothetical protein